MLTLQFRLSSPFNTFLTPGVYPETMSVVEPGQSHEMALAVMLGEGLRLEDRGVLLPWNILGKQLQALGTPVLTPVRCDRAGKTTLVRLWWENAEFLGGLRGSVSTTMRFTERLRFVEIHDAPQGADADAHFTRLERHLADQLGRPTNREARQEPASVEWLHTGFFVRLFIAERMGKQCRIEVWAVGNGERGNGGWA